MISIFSMKCKYLYEYTFGYPSCRRIGINHVTKIKNKNEKIAEKILSFASNVASAILGNILSNPLLNDF